MVQVFRFKLDTDNFVVPSQPIISLLAKLFYQRFFRKFLPEILFFPKFGRDGVYGHDGVFIQLIKFYFIRDLIGIGQTFRKIGKQFIHFLCGFKPLLFGILHPVWIIEVFAGIQANEQIVCIGIPGIREMDIVGGNNLHPGCPGKFQDFPVHNHLPVINFPAQFRDFRRMPLQLKVKIFSEYHSVPVQGFFRIFHPPVGQQCGNLTTQARRGHNQPLRILLQ